MKISTRNQEAASVEVPDGWSINLVDANYWAVAGPGTSGAIAFTGRKFGLLGSRDRAFQGQSDSLQGAFDALVTYLEREN